MANYLVQEFEQLWNSADAPPDVWGFLQQQTTVDSDQWLAVLLSDQRRRWLTDSPLKVEDYLAGLPDLPEGVDWKLQLAIGELEARHDTERPLSQNEISSCFPEIGDTLRDKLSQADSGNDEDQRLRHATTHFGDSVAGKSFVGRYRLLRVLGEGAFGRVCLGIDDELQRQVAIKMPTAERFQKSEDAEQYLAEARTGEKGRRLGLVVHHTDAEREFAYDRNSHVGKLDKVLDMAADNDWIIVDMKHDWKQVFPNKK